MNDGEQSLREVISMSQALLTLQQCIYDCHHEAVRKISLFILSVLCVLPSKYFAIGSILASMGTYSIQKGTQRFSSLL